MRSGPAEGALLLALLALGGCTLTVREADIFNPPPREGPQPPGEPATVIDGTSGQSVYVLPMTVRAPDGVLLRGWYIMWPEFRRYLMFLHGNGGVMSRTRTFLVWLGAHLKTNILALDYRGYGFSTGKPGIDDCCADALHAYDALAALRSGSDGPIFVYGYSLGSCFAVHVAAHRPVAGLILQAPVTSAAEVCEHFSPWYLRWLIRFEADPALRNRKPQPIDTVASLTTPLLVIHGSADEVIPISLGRKLFEQAAAAEKVFCEVPGGAHMALPVRKPPVCDALKQFVERHSGATGRG